MHGKSKSTRPKKIEPAETAEELRAEIKRITGRTSLYPHEMAVLRCSAKGASKQQLVEALIVISGALADQEARIRVIEARLNPLE